LRHATLAAQIDEHPQQKIIRNLDHDRERLSIQLDRKRERGMMSSGDLKDAQKELKAMWKEARSIERSLADDIIGRAQIVLATHGGIGQSLARDMFDLVVLDEASQSTEALSWVPISHAKKVILAGDPLQLPPTLFSDEAKKGLLGTTLMDRLYKSLPEEFKTLLRVQYRMNRAIMGFSSREFYDDKLIAHESVADHLAKDLPDAKPTDLTQKPIVFIDTAGTGFHEVWNEPLDSRENAGEAQIIVKVWEQLQAAGLYDDDVAIITPYSAQVRMLKQLLPRSIEVNTVDGFQGREKEIVLLSLVRSNDKGEVGFLSDTRRMNVAMTRARRLLVVVGDSLTLTKNPFDEDRIFFEKFNLRRPAEPRRGLFREVNQNFFVVIPDAPFQARSGTQK
jgi:ATP-dependent RNA/DNA helicase IGHMBP2